MKHNKRYFYQLSVERLLQTFGQINMVLIATIIHNTDSNSRKISQSPYLRWTGST